ncbi:MAG: hypothetical protein U5L96_08315 [Owenweeksia sp.]|nr:hypothetical protein [Owenweeksia sp.]
MKKLLLLLIASLLLPGHSEASHAAGGEIYYRYIGDSTGTSHEYEFNLILYRREQGIGFGTAQTLDIASSCFINTSLTLNQVPGKSNATIPFSGECVDTNSSAYEKYTYYHYRGTKVLSGICHDYKFSWSQCCRNSNITNLASNTNFYFEATLNNTLGPNNSPRFANFGIKSLCVNRKVNWSQKALEPDSDSLVYELAQPSPLPIHPLLMRLVTTCNNPLLRKMAYNLTPEMGISSLRPCSQITPP